VVRNVAAFALISLGSLDALSAVGARRDPGCGGADSPSSGPNAPCTRSKDCGSGLVCAEGVCTEPDSGATPPSDGGGRDATPASGGDAADDSG
jgi:hypothetical protein